MFGSQGKFDSLYRFSIDFQIHCTGNFLIFRCIVDRGDPAADFFSAVIIVILREDIAVFSDNGQIERLGFIAVERRVDIILTFQMLMAVFFAPRISGTVSL